MLIEVRRHIAPKEVVDFLRSNASKNRERVIVSYSCLLGPLEGVDGTIESDLVVCCLLFYDARPLRGEFRPPLCLRQLGS
jgi:hypothetical protein